MKIFCLKRFLLVIDFFDNFLIEFQIFGPLNVKTKFDIMSMIRWMVVIYYMSELSKQETRR